MTICGLASGSSQGRSAIDLGAAATLIRTVRAASRAMGAVFGTEPVIIREGGSIPPVEMFQRLLGIQSVLVGVGLPDDHIHAPNEKFDLDHYAMGVRVLARLWDEIAKEMG